MNANGAADKPRSTYIYCGFPGFIKNKSYGDYYRYDCCILENSSRDSTDFRGGSIHFRFSIRNIKFSHEEFLGMTIQGGFDVVL